MKKLLVLSLVCVTVIAQAQGGRGGMRGGGQSMTGLLNRADVQTELKMTQEQIDKIKELAPQRGQGGGAGGGGGAGAGGGGGQTDPAQMRQMMAEREKAVLAVLKPEQVTRLRELYVQRAGNRALTREDIQKELGLRADQVAKIQSIIDDQRSQQQELRQAAQDGSLSREEMQAKSQEITKAVNENLGKVLDEKQAAKFKAMRGAEFKFDEGN